jgi:hypothetical protein
VERITPAAFGCAPTFVTANRNVIAMSLGMAGAEVEVFDTKGHAQHKVQIDLERAVRAIDLSVDDKSALVSIIGRGSAELRVVALADGSTTRTIPLEAADASGSFDRGPEGIWLEGGSIIARSGSALIQVKANGTTQKLADVPQGAFIRASSDKKWFVVSTPDDITLRAASNPATAVAHRKRSTKKGALPDPRAFVDNTGTLLFEDQGQAILRDRSGKERDLGEGRARGLTEHYALVGAPGSRTDSASIEIVERSGTARARVAAADAVLLPTEDTILVNSGGDECHAITPLALQDVQAGSVAMLLSPPNHIAFSRDGKSVMSVDSRGVDDWNIATKKRARRLQFPSKSDGARGIFRTVDQTFVLAGDVYRLDATGLEPAGSSYVRRPRAFTKKDGTTVVCFSDGAEHCQLHTVIGPGQKEIGDPVWPFIVPLSSGRGFLEGLYKDGGLDLGASKIVPSKGGARIPLDETWLRDVDLWWATPAEDGAVIITTEGPDRSSRRAFVRRVRDTGLGAPCSLGAARPSQDAALALSPNGRLAAIPIRGDETAKGAVLFVDVDQCTGGQMNLPAPALTVDFSPDGQSLAIGLSDRSIGVAHVPR